MYNRLHSDGWIRSNQSRMALHQPSLSCLSGLHAVTPQAAAPSGCQHSRGAATHPAAGSAFKQGMVANRRDKHNEQRTLKKAREQNIGFTFIFYFILFYFILFSSCNPRAVLVQFLPQPAPHTPALTSRQGERDKQCLSKKSVPTTSPKRCWTACSAGCLVRAPTLIEYPTPSLHALPSPHDKYSAHGVAAAAAADAGSSPVAVSGW